MPEIFCFDDLIINFMFFIEPKAQSHKNSGILEMSKNLQFFCDIAEKLYSRNTILPLFSYNKMISVYRRRFDLADNFL
jgi:hypothetical protein